MNNHHYIKIKYFFISILAFNISLANANSISLEQVTRDITYLANDDMAGRANFSPQIDKAANYIAKRFAQIGLSPLNGNDSFKQTFDLYNVKPDVIDIRINHAQVPPEKTILLSSRQTINWTNNSDVKILYIKGTDDFRKSIAEVNHRDENILAIVDNKHADIFNRYQKHFGQGLNRFKMEQGPTAILVLSSIDKIEHFNVSAKSIINKRSLTNVTGILPGKSKVDEMLLFSAHYDHLGVADNDTTGDHIYNGADDDASGTSAVINLAEYFAKAENNQRTLIFVAFTAEELGGFGSKYFSERLDPDKITAMINIEMIGKPSKFGPGEFWMTGYDKSNLGEILNKNLKAKNKKLHVDPYPKQRLFYRSDNATLARLGVPAHSFSSSQIDKDKHYHKVSDEVDSLDLKSMTAIMQSLAEAVESLVDGSDTASRIDIGQVKKSGYYF